MTNVVPKHELESIIEKSTDGLIVVDHNSIIRFINPAAACLFKRSPAEMVSKSFEYPLSPGHSTEMEIIRKNGKPGTGEIRSVDIEWEGQKALLVSIRDITERILFDRLKDDFIGNVSHELRTPLTSIREAVSVIQDGILGPVSEEQKKFLSMCIRNTDHLRRIVDSLLDLTKIEAGKARLNKKRTQFPDIIKSVIEVFQPISRKKGLALNLSIPKNGMEVYVDRDRITQVLNNLIGNAIKFTEKGTIGVSVDEINGWAECRVSDTGEGISEEDLPKVFDKFMQFGKKTNPENKGTGLGLAISREIIQMHNGSMSVESVFNQGSTFKFRLPRYRPDLEVEDPIRTAMEAKQPFALFGIRLHAVDAIGAQMGGQPLQKIAQKIRHMFETLGKTVIPIVLEPDSVFILVEKSHEQDPRSIARLRHMTKEAFIGLGIDEEVDFSYGRSLYPLHAEAPNLLLEACRKDMRNERLERFNKRIMIVDDEPALIEATKTLLELFGYKTIEALSNGAALFERMKTVHPDLLILDMKMPGMTGYEVIGRLKESFKTQEIPILIMSGYEIETGRFIEYVNTKAILTLNKPADPDILRKTVYYLI
ncbi:response regulator [bacterium]|nr:response regulator [bacterium]